jgi:hypothetical protein
MEKLGSRWTDLHKIWYLRIVWKSAENIQVSLRPHKNNGCFRVRFTYIYYDIYDIYYDIYYDS